MALWVKVGASRAEAVLLLTVLGFSGLGNELPLALGPKVGDLIRVAGSKPRVVLLFPTLITYSCFSTNEEMFPPVFWLLSLSWA